MGIEPEHTRGKVWSSSQHAGQQIDGIAEEGRYFGGVRISKAFQYTKVRRLKFLDCRDAIVLATGMNRKSSIPMIRARLHEAPLPLLNLKQHFELPSDRTGLAPMVERGDDGRAVKVS